MKAPIDTQSWNRKYLLPNDKDLDFIQKSMKDEIVYNILVGSFRSAKSTTLRTAFCMNLELSNDDLFYAIATTESNAKTILFDGGGLGIKNFPDWQERWETLASGKKVRMPQRIYEGKYKQRDALILYPLPYENKPVKYIVAYGGDKESSYKAFRGQDCGMVIATEVNLLHPNTITEYMGRIGASSRKKVFEDLNPGNPRQWVKTDHLDYLMKERSHEVNYGHRTLRDNPRLSERQIESLSGSYPIGSVFHRNLILGEWVAAEGLIYAVDREKNIIDSFNPIDYKSYVIVADPGVNHSATVFSLVAVTRDNKYIDTLREYYHKNANKMGLSIKMPIDYALDYIVFIKECIELMGKAPAQVMSDLDLTFIREFDRNKYNHGLAGINISKEFKKEEIKDRIKNGVNLIHLGRKRFYKDCINTIESYETAQYDPKESIKGNYIRWDEPSQGTKIDSIDTNEYAETYYRYELNMYRG